MKLYIYIYILLDIAHNSPLNQWQTDVRWWIWWIHSFDVRRYSKETWDSHGDIVILGKNQTSVY